MIVIIKSIMIHWLGQQQLRLTKMHMISGTIEIEKLVRCLNISQFGIE